MKASPWGDMLASALALGVTPDVFWRLSVKEWRELTSADAAPLTRAELEALACAYPDRSHD